MRGGRHPQNRQHINYGQDKEYYGYQPQLSQPPFPPIMEIPGRQDIPPFIPERYAKSVDHVFENTLYVPEDDQNLLTSDTTKLCNDMIKAPIEVLKAYENLVESINQAGGFITGSTEKARFERAIDGKRNDIEARLGFLKTIEESIQSPPEDLFGLLKE